MSNNLFWITVLIIGLDVVIGFVYSTKRNGIKSVAFQQRVSTNYFNARNVDLSSNQRIQTKLSVYHHDTTINNNKNEVDVLSMNARNVIVVAGATGYIGRAVVQESVRRGYPTVALVRNRTAIQASLSSPEGQQSRYGTHFQGAFIMECNVEDPHDVHQCMVASQNQYSLPIDAVISCLAAPSGTRKDTNAIDYQATMNCYNAGKDVMAKHFILLSAFCCRNPLLQLQQAKLQVEQKLMESQQQQDQQHNPIWTVIRPTAFFKSISGQFEAIRDGAPYILFGNGTMTECNPIDESELAEFMLDSIIDSKKWNRILNVGGPDLPLTNQKIAEIMFQSLGKEPRYVYVPSQIFDMILGVLQYVADFTQSPFWEDALETAKIGKYYAVEDMLTTDPTEKYGTITVQDHFQKIATVGQDPFTPVRATAVIGKTLEMAKAIFPISTIFMMMINTILSSPAMSNTNQGLFQKLEEEWNFSIMLATLTHNNQM